jgi:hypothetical protein
VQLVLGNCTNLQLHVSHAIEFQLHVSHAIEFQLHATVGKPKISSTDKDFSLDIRMLEGLGIIQTKVY